MAVQQAVAERWKKVTGCAIAEGYGLSETSPSATCNLVTATEFSGTIGIMDARGFTKIVDRKKDMILVSGFNVYPNEIEEVMANMPQVLECAAVGAPDAHSSEAVKLFVVKKAASRGLFFSQAA